ncbi:eCIS core domain-containing protein [Cellulomonas sp. NPDC055163]
MREHEHEHLDDDAQRPRTERTEERPDSALWRAAAAGRTDVVGPQGLARLQRAVGNQGVRGLAQEERSPVLDVVGSGGSPLDTHVRTDMESRLGHDFGDVRVHTDDAAHRSAASVQAHAYTVGSDVVFQNGQYDPGSTAGRTMLAHELTHVVQQRSGPVDGTATGDGVRVSDPSDRFEREAAANAERVMSAPPVQTAPVTGGGGAPGGAAVQRQEGDEEAPEEAPVQGAFEAGAAVQREESEEEEAPAG